MPVLTTTVDPNSDTFRANRRALQEAVDVVAEQLAEARAGGGERYVQRHKERGKLLAHERIETVPAFRAALERALSPQAGSAIVHVQTDRARNVKLHRELWEAVANALHAQNR